MQSLLCVMLPVFIVCQTMFPSVKEQRFMYLILLLTEHYSKGEVRDVNDIIYDKNRKVNCHLDVAGVQHVVSTTLIHVFM